MSFSPHPCEWFEQACAAKHRNLDLDTGLSKQLKDCRLLVHPLGWSVDPLCSQTLVKHVWKKWWLFPLNNKRCVISFVLAKALPWGMGRNPSQWAIKYLNLWCPALCTVGFLNQPAFLRTFVDCLEAVPVPAMPAAPSARLLCSVVSSAQALTPVGWQTQEWLESKLGSV